MVANALILNKDYAKPSPSAVGHAEVWEISSYGLYSHSRQPFPFAVIRSSLFESSLAKYLTKFTAHLRSVSIYPRTHSKHIIADPPLASSGYQGS